MIKGNTYVIGDIHGGKKALEQLIKKLHLSPKDHLIFLGDYCDGWSESAETLLFLMTLRKTQSCTFIKGNHDALTLEWLVTGKRKEDWLKHGGLATVQSFSKLADYEIAEIKTFLGSLKTYVIDDKNRLFLHAGFTHLQGPQREYFEEMCYWDRTLWEAALAVEGNVLEDDIHYPSRLKIFKEIYIGHTPTVRINKTTPVNAACVWNVDTGAAFYGPLTALNIDTKEYIQTDPVYTFYSDERGRN